MGIPPPYPGGIPANNGNPYLFILYVALLASIIYFGAIGKHISPPRFRLRAPVNAKYLFYIFLDQNNCDAIVGDLEERYRIIRRKFGPRRATFWYWTQAIRSVGPIAWAWTKWVMKAVSGIAALVEIYRRIRS